MRKLTLLGVLLAASCRKPSPPAMPPAAPAAAEPSQLTVKHVLIGVKGGQLPTAKREKAEAERFAFEILARARSGEDFDRLVQEYSEDDGKTPYTMTNTGIPAGTDEIPRTTMYKGFGDVSFGLQVGQVGIAEYDPVTSAYGYHVIKRVK